MPPLVRPWIHLLLPSTAPRETAAEDAPLIVGPPSAPTRMRSLDALPDQPHPAHEATPGAATRRQPVSAIRRACGLLPLPIALAALYSVGGLSIGSQMSPIIRFAFKLGDPAHACRDVRRTIHPASIAGFHCKKQCDSLSEELLSWGRCTEAASTLWTRACAVLNACPRKAVPPSARAHPHACVRGVFANADGATCGARGVWLVGNVAGLNHTGALMKVSLEYPKECGVLMDVACGAVLRSFQEGHLVKPGRTSA